MRAHVAGLLHWRMSISLKFLVLLPYADDRKIDIRDRRTLLVSAHPLTLEKIKFLGISTEVGKHLACAIPRSVRSHGCNATNAERQQDTPF